MPVTAFVGLVAACGIAGVPLFNGYISKTLLHHAIVEAAEHNHLRLLYTAERLFMLTGAGTACSFIKFYYLIFLRSPQRAYKPIKENRSMQLSMLALTVAIVLLGVLPHFFLARLMEPAMDVFLFDHHHVQSHLLGLNFFNLHDLWGVAAALLLGFVIFFVGMRTGFFHLHLPAWMGEEYLGRKAESFLVRMWSALYGRYRFFKGEVLHLGGNLSRKGGHLLNHLDNPVLTRSENTGWVSFANLDFDFLVLVFLLLFFLLENLF